MAITYGDFRIDRGDYDPPDEETIPLDGYYDEPFNMGANMTERTEAEWERLNAVFHDALAKYPHSHHALHFLWNAAISTGPETAKEPPSFWNREDWDREPDHGQYSNPRR